MAGSIVKLARLAGVSKSTVSRVLSGQQRTSPEAVKAVRRAVQKIGYEKPTSNVGRPRRSPAGIGKGSIVLLFPDTDPQALRTILSGQLLHGIEQVVRSHGLSLVVSGLTAPGRLPPSIANRQVDGVLVRGFGSDGADAKAIMDGIGTLPTVHVFEPRATVPATWDVVLEDNTAIGKIAADYLLSRGRRRLGLINNLPKHPSLRHRLRSFRDAVEDAGFKVRSVIAANVPTGQMVDELLADGPLDGLFIPANSGPNDLVVEVYRALAARGIEPCRDADLISCVNDVPRLMTLDPRLANIDIQAQAIGRAAAERLLSRLRNPEETPCRLAIPPRLVGPADSNTPPDEARPFRSKTSSSRINR